MKIPEDRPRPQGENPQPLRRLHFFLFENPNPSRPLRSVYLTQAPSPSARLRLCPQFTTDKPLPGRMECLGRLTVAAVFLVLGVVGGVAGEGVAGAAALEVAAPAEVAAAPNASSVPATAGAPAVASELREKEKKGRDTCDEHRLAAAIVEDCTDKSAPSPGCCVAVVAAVDIRGCLCHVAVDSALVDAGETMTPHDVMRMYDACGGVRRLPKSLDAACRGEGPKSPACHLVRRDEGILLGTSAAQMFEDLALLYMLLEKAWKYLKAARAALRAQPGAPLV